MEQTSLSGKLVYGFGDSIVYGHTHPEYCFLRQLSEKYGFRLENYAVNGATVMRSDNHILAEVENAPDVQPDFIVFNGFTNDCYASAEGKIGEISEGFDGPFDDTLFVPGFEKIIKTMKDKYPQAKLIYVAMHKSNARPDMITEKGERVSVQVLMQKLTHEVCAKWGVTVADLWNESPFDTNLPGMSEKYIIDGAGSQPNEEACRRFYVPMVEKAMLRVS